MSTASCQQNNSNKARDLRHKDILQVGGTDILAEVLTWLTSADAVKCAASCKGLHIFLSDEAHAFWAPDARQTGSHTNACVWLHTIATAAEISSYMLKSRQAHVLKPLRFKAGKDVAAVSAAIDACGRTCLSLNRDSPEFLYAVTNSVATNQFVYQCNFNISDIEAISMDESTSHRIWSSTSVKVCWENAVWNQINLQMRLSLCRSSQPLAQGKLFFQWEVLTSGVQIHDFDYLEIYVDGCIISSKKKARAQPWRSLPFTNTYGAKSLEVRGEALQKMFVSPKCAAFKSLLRGEPVTCVGRFELWYMGEPQSIWFPSDKSMHE